MRLQRPNQRTACQVRDDTDSDIDQEAAQEFISHCDAIGFILARSFSLWGANRKIKRYLAITGAKLQCAEGNM